MSYGVAAALQAAIYQHLSGNGALTALVGTAIFDAAPPGRVAGTYVSLGPETVRDQSDKTGHGASHDIVISVVSDAAGFATAKAAAGAVSDALTDPALTLSRGHLVSLSFLRAEARRVRNADIRRIDLTFRARVDDDQP